MSTQVVRSFRGISRARGRPGKLIRIVSLMPMLQQFAFLAKLHLAALMFGPASASIAAFQKKRKKACPNYATPTLCKLAQSLRYFTNSAKERTMQVGSQPGAKSEIFAGVAAVFSGGVFGALIFILIEILGLHPQGRIAFLLLAMAACVPISILVGIFRVLRGVYLWKGIIAATGGFAALVLVGFAAFLFFGGIDLLI